MGVSETASAALAAGMKIKNRTRKLRRAGKMS
jgi:hypothetical protein